MEFKVGDKVKLIKDGLNNYSKFKVGHTFIIQEIIDGYLRHTQGQGTGVHNTYCELVEEDKQETNSQYNIGDIVTGGYEERRGVIVNVKSSEVVIEIDSEYNDYKGWENNGQDPDIPKDYKPVLSNRYSIIGFDIITSHIKKESKSEPDKTNGFVKYENGTRCKIIGNHNGHDKEIGSIITITEYTGYSKNKNGFAYYANEHHSTVFRSIDLEEVKEEVSTFKVGDYVKYKNGQAIYIITTLVGTRCNIKHILDNNIYAANIDKLELVRPEHLQWLDDDGIRYSSNYNYKTGCIDSIELLKIDESILNTYVILNKDRGAQLDIEWYESRGATCSIDSFKIRWDKPYTILICEEDGDFIWEQYDTYEEMIKDNEEDGYRLISNGIDNNNCALKSYEPCGEVNGKPTGYININIGLSGTDTLEKTILNTNTKHTMSTLSKIQTEEFFSNKKNVKAIEETISELNRLEESFYIVRNDLDNKINKISSLRSKLNSAVSNDDIKSIQEQLVVLKPRVEFLNRYEENTIKELGFTETKVTSPEDFFKS